MAKKRYITVQYPYGGTGRYINWVKKRYQVRYSTPMVARVSMFWPERGTVQYSTLPLWWHNHFGKKKVQCCTPMVARVGILFRLKRGTVQYPHGGTGRYILTKTRYSSTAPLWWHASVYYYGQKEVQYGTPMVARVGIFWQK